LLEDSKERITFLKKLHQTNPELAHQVGKDSCCLYCDEYKKLVNEIKSYPDMSETRLNMGIKKLYFVELEDESKFLVLVHHPERLEKMLKKEESAIKFVNKIPQKYWKTYYIENEFGELVPVDNLLKGNKRVRIIAKKGESIDHKQTGYVTPKVPLSYFIYNEHNFKELEDFVFPSKVERAKEFKQKGQLYIKTVLGKQILDYDQVLLKLPADVLVIYSKEDFFNNFESDEEMVWKTY